MDQCRSNPLMSLLAPAAVLVACLAFPATTRAELRQDLASYGSYALRCVAAGQKPEPVSVWLRRLRAGAARPFDASVPELGRSPGDIAARQDYLRERARHDELRRRAELLSQSPRMSHYQSRVNDLRAEDERKIAAFDLQAALSGGPAAALPELKRHDERLEKMVDQAQQVVGR